MALRNKHDAKDAVKGSCVQGKDYKDDCKNHKKPIGANHKEGKTHGW